MNDRTRAIFARVIGQMGSAAAGASVFVFGGFESVVIKVLIATLAGALGLFVFTALGRLILQLERKLSVGRPSDSVYAFGNLPVEQGSLAGGKGRVLSLLYQKGFPVPDGCVLLPSAFVDDSITDPAWERVRLQLKRLRGNQPVRFAVRSSALCEDSAQASFAGEFESVLDVVSDEEIRAAVQSVLRSRLDGRVQAYRQAKGMNGDEHQIAVVIQKLIPADFSGVLFTADPLTGSQMHMVGNFVQGMGDQLVSGQVLASSFTIDRPGGVYEGPDVLQQIAKKIHQEAHEIERFMGCPQDIEWAVSGKRLFILQSRPITTLNPFNPITAEWNDTLKGHFLWSATNLMEACPEVLTPFTASLRPFLEKQAGPNLVVKNHSLNGIIGGRFYANITVQVSAFSRQFKGDTRRAYREMAGWWGDLPEEMEIPLLPLTKQDWNQDILPNLLRTMWQFRQYRRRAAQFLKLNRQHCANLRGKIRQTTTKTGLLDLWEKEILPAYRDSMFHIVASGSDAQVRLERDLRSLVGAEDANALLSNLGGKSGKLESLGPMVGIGMVLRGEMSREDYLERYGHRGVNEGEAAWPRPEEDPNWLERQMNEWKHSPVDVEAMLMRQRAAYDAAWDRFSRQYPRKVKSMQNRLKQAARSAQLREQVRSEGTRGMTVLRAFALHAGKLLDIGEDIFFLTIDETLAGLAGDLSAVQHIPVRKDVHARYQALPPYPAIICGRFDPFAWAADPNRRSDVFDSLQAAPPSAEVDMNVIRGAAGALGVVEGTVRRLDRIEDSHQFLAGEVLVTTMTNIGWTPLFPRAAAIITDLGAPLSHAAIVARELGIPAVVGCGDATMRLHTGDRVRVDGAKGLVTILDPKPGS